MLRAKLAVTFSYFLKNKESKTNGQKGFNYYSYLKEESIRTDFDSKVSDLLNQR